MVIWEILVSTLKIGTFNILSIELFPSNNSYIYILWVNPLKIIIN
jgi:hypothetical protein